MFNFVHVTRPAPAPTVAASMTQADGRTAMRLRLQEAVGDLLAESAIGSLAVTAGPTRAVIDGEDFLIVEAGACDWGDGPCRQAGFRWKDVTRLEVNEGLAVVTTTGGRIEYRAA